MEVIFCELPNYDIFISPSINQLDDSIVTSLKTINYPCQQ
jgi:hypothetical protein